MSEREQLEAILGTFRDVLDAQQAFTEKFEAKEGVSGIGVGRDSAGDGYALRVLIASRQVAETLPREIDGVEVIYEVVGKISAYGATAN